MGLKGIHDPNALWHFAGYTYCPWCSKDRQNEGTIINYLRTVHSKAGPHMQQVFLMSYSDVGCPLPTWTQHLY